MHLIHLLCFTSIYFLLVFFTGNRNLPKYNICLRIVIHYCKNNLLKARQVNKGTAWLIYARVHHKQIPYYKPGGKLLLFKYDEIQEWIKSGRHATMDEIRERI